MDASENPLLNNYSPTPLPMFQLPVKRCACGCGKEVPPTKESRIYWSHKCRVRVARKRVLLRDLEQQMPEVAKEAKWNYAPTVGALDLQARLMLTKGGFQGVTYHGVTVEWTPPEGVSWVSTEQTGVWNMVCLAAEKLIESVQIPATTLNAAQSELIASGLPAQREFTGVPVPWAPQDWRIGWMQVATGLWRMTFTPRVPENEQVDKLS